ncbi:MAG: phosphoglucosamine mutase [Fibrobacter sp.]|nr:phosphoglucosamine mutase [Fibrobacter sp.]
MSELPIMSVSGIRGIVGKTIDSAFVSRIAYIQTKLSGGGKVIVGRDTRSSGEMLAEAAFKGIRAAGGIPIYLGVAPTPTTCLCTSSLGGSTGIIITASHNPGQYNGYKMVHSSGRLFRAHECQSVYDAFYEGDYASDAEIKKARSDAQHSVDGSAIHIEKILSKINVNAIRSANIKIAVDSINGAGGAVFPALLSRLGVEWKGVHNKLDGDFVHNPEPRPEHLGDLSNLLKSTPGNWGGFVFDPDADRLATMGENGEEISEEMTLVFALQNLLGREKSDVATNLSTSMLIDDVATRSGVKVYRSKIGEANVVEVMEQNKCRYGGEGNGGVIFPEIASARDGLTGMALILELMAKTGMRLTQIASQWPRYSIVKEKIDCAGINPAEVISKLEKVFADEHTDRLDGLKIIRDYGWVHLRSSNTEPIIRCYAEAHTEQQARDLADMVLKMAKCS